MLDRLAEFLWEKIRCVFVDTSLENEYTAIGLPKFAFSGLKKLGASMKRTTFFFFVAIFSSVAVLQISDPAASQTTQAPPAAEEVSNKPVAELLSWMIGDWEGEGKSPGDLEFIAKMKVTPELDYQALLLSRESINKAAGGATAVKKELLVIGLDGTTKKIIMTLNTSNNFIGIYSGELKQDEIVFSLVTSQPGYVNRRTFKLIPDGTLSYVVEGATPGKEVSKLLEISFKKKL